VNRIPNHTHEQIVAAIVTRPACSNCCPTQRIDERSLTAETVEGTALALERVNNVKRGDSLALGVLGVGDGVTDDTLKEGLENTTGLFVDHCKEVNSCTR
jgi:hypothetical protein